MKKIVTSVFLFLSAQGMTQNLIRFVQPLSGTAPSKTISALKHSEAGSEKNANTIPAVGLPFGMTQWTAQTRFGETKCIPPYYYNGSLFSGIRGTHWISGSCMQDYGSFTIMPVSGKLQTTNYAAPFSHDNETSTPAYYKLDLPSLQLTTEVTSTLRCGMMRFTMQKDDSLYLLIIPNSDQQKAFIKIDTTKEEIWGYNPAHRIYQGWGESAGFNGWFFIQFQKKISSKGTFSEDNLFSIDSIANQKNIGAYVGFYLKKGEELQIRIGTSFSNLDGAKKNLQVEIPSWSFDNILTETKQKWEESLSQIQVETDNDKNKRIFYTALYHAFQHPRLFSDVDGAYPKFAGKYELRKMQDGNYYDDFSMWDIYRAQLPLLEILQPRLINQFVQSMIAKGQQGTWLPVFPCWNNTLPL